MPLHRLGLAGGHTTMMVRLILLLACMPRRKEGCIGSSRDSSMFTEGMRYTDHY